MILKERKANIKLVNSHYAEVNNEFAKEYNEKKVKLHIYTTDDSRLWFTIDHSFNLDEAEFLHPETAKPDITKVKAVFNDIRDKPIYLPSETKSFLDRTDDTLNRLVETTKMEIENKKLHQRVLKSMDNTLKAIRKELGHKRNYFKSDEKNYNLKRWM